MSSRPKHLYEFGPFLLNPTERTLLREGQRVRLRPKVFDMLLVLVENSGRLVAKEELMRAVWPEQFVEEGNLNKNVSMLREALGESPASPTYIETEPKRGYRFVGEVRTVDGDQTELVVQTRTRTSFVVEEEVDDEAQTLGRVRAERALVGKPWADKTAVSAQLAGKSERGLKSKIALAVAAAIIVLAGSVYLFYPRRGGEAIDSVAVLPFVNVDRDPNKEYLSDGISDSIINTLARVSTLRVISLNAVQRFKGKSSDAQDVGKALNVRAVLIGRFTQQGDNLVISTELIDVRDNRRLWGEKYNRKLSEILVVQTEIAQEISQTLRLQLSPQDQKQITKRHTENAEAYRLYNLGKFNGGGYTANTSGKPELEKAVNYYQEAIKLDDHYALAYVGLAGAYHALGFRGFWLPKDAWQKAEWAALKAVELDDTLAEAHVALAGERFHRDPAGAEKELKRALELDPDSVEANGTYALALVITGRRDEAIAYAERAEEFNKRLTGGPERPAAVAFVYFLARQYDQAIEGYKRALEKYPNNPHFHFLLGEVYLVKGMYQDGLMELERAVALDNAPERWDRYPVLAFAYAVAGKRAEAQKILTEQQTLSKQRYVSPYNFAIIYTGLGDKDRAFEYLNRAYDEDVYVMNQFPARPIFDSLRSDPRYQELLKKMNRPIN